MAPIGDQLRAARERKGLTLERVADETNIAKRYLAALEAEEFGVFPGDPYAIGFLRNYAEYLGLPSDELATSFKNMRIQEQPAPIQELIPRRGPSRAAIAGIACGAVALAAVVLVLALGARRGAGGAEEAAHRAPTEYSADGASLEKRLYVGDSVLVGLGAEKYKLLVARIDDAVTLDTPVGATRLMLGEEGELDLDRNNKADIKVMVSDLSKKDPGKGALMRIEYQDAAAADAMPDQAAPAAAGAIPTAAAQAQAAALEPAAPAAIAVAPGKPVVVFEANKSPYPFVVSVTFRGSCLLRYEVDKRDRDERYYRKGETVTVNASNNIKLWASNAQSAKLTIMASGGKSADLDLGGAGEVAVKRIAWSQTETGTWALGASDVD
jgi:cytoskeleton protein RodZ